jgi:hypothetical protein
MVLRECPVTRAVAERLTPSTRRLATWLNAFRLQRRPRYAVPVFVLRVVPQLVQRYRRRRPDLAVNQPWHTMLTPGWPKLSHPGLLHETSSIALIAQVYPAEKPVPAPRAHALDRGRPINSDRRKHRADYVINAVAPRNSTQALILRATGPYQFVAAGSAAVSFPTANQLRVTVPLTLLGNDDGRLKFKVVCSQYLSDTTVTGITDYMPDLGLPPGVVR